jgi:vitamin K-dependent gamma-carboxylase
MLTQSGSDNFINKPISNCTLELFRIVFGLIIFFDSAGALALGWVKEIFVDTNFTFTFIGFEFLQALHGPYMYWHYSFIAITGILIALGLFYRFVSIAFVLLWTTSYLMQKQHYNNHYYLMILLGLIMAIVPAGKRFSLDSKWGITQKQLYCPAWSINIIILQFAIVYFYAAIAKLYPDWIEGIPLQIWLTEIAKNHFLGTWLANSHLIKILAIGGILFDLLIIPALLWNKTRWMAVTASLIFHLFNSVVFQIGSFPYLMLGALILLFPANAIENKFFNSQHSIPNQSQIKTISTPLYWLLFIYLILQVALPLRHHAYGSEVNWTEEGHRMSWRMMLRTKSGSIYFKCIDPNTQETWILDPLTIGITPNQKSTMAKSPDMIWQFVQYSKKHYHDEGKNNLEIYAFSKVSLNGKAYQPYTDSEINLASVPWNHFSKNQWVLPLKK